jgi:hypothetical protein
MLSINITQLCLFIHLYLLKVKSQTKDLEVEIVNRNGVEADVDAFHHHLPSELPLAPPTQVEKDQNA